MPQTLGRPHSRSLDQPHGFGYTMPTECQVTAKHANARLSSCSTWAMGDCVGGTSMPACREVAGKRPLVSVDPAIYTHSPSPTPLAIGGNRDAGQETRIPASGRGRCIRRRVAGRNTAAG